MSGRSSAIPPRSIRSFRKRFDAFDGEMLDHAAAGDPEAGSRPQPPSRTAGAFADLPPRTHCSTRSARHRAACSSMTRPSTTARTCCVSFASMVFHSPATARPPSTPHKWHHNRIMMSISIPDAESARSRAPVPAPADLRREVQHYDQTASVEILGGPALSDGLPDAG